jgi:hypothetical protein
LRVDSNRIFKAGHFVHVYSLASFALHRLTLRWGVTIR